MQRATWVEACGPLVGHSFIECSLGGMCPKGASSNLWPESAPQSSDLDEHECHWYQLMRRRNHMGWGLSRPGRLETSKFRLLRRSRRPFCFRSGPFLARCLPWHLPFPALYLRLPSSPRVLRVQLRRGPQPRVPAVGRSRDRTFGCAVGGGACVSVVVARRWQERERQVCEGRLHDRAGQRALRGVGVACLGPGWGVLRIGRFQGGRGAAIAVGCQRPMHLGGHHVWASVSRCDARARQGTCASCVHECARELSCQTRVRVDPRLQSSWFGSSGLTQAANFDSPSGHARIRT